VRIVLAGGQHLLVAADGALDGIVRQATLVCVSQCRAQLSHRPVAGETPVAQPTHHVPAQRPPGHGQGRFGCRTEGPGVGWTHPLGTMGALTDSLHGAIEGAQTTVAMIAHGELAPTGPAPPLLDGQVEAGKDRVFRPAVWHGVVPSLTGMALTTIIPARIVKIFELAFPLKVTLLPSHALWLVFRPTITHTQRPYGRQRLRGEAMDWKHLLAYITGTVDQALLLRNEYLVTENRILRNQIKGRVHLSDGESTPWPR